MATFLPWATALYLAIGLLIGYGSINKNNRPIIEAISRAIENRFPETEAFRDHPQYQQTVVFGFAVSIALFWLPLGLVLWAQGSKFVFRLPWSSKNNNDRDR